VETERIELLTSPMPFKRSPDALRNAHLYNELKFSVVIS